MSNENQSISYDLKENICGHIDNWIRNSKDFTTASFARALGISFTSVKRWQDRICLPDLLLLPKICEIMNITLPTLLGVEGYSELSHSETALIDIYRADPNFKYFADRYISDDDFRISINALVKLSK